MRLDFLIALLAFSTTHQDVYSQGIADPLLEVDGAIQIGNSAESFADPGTIRWSGTDFEVWKDNHWVSLTGVPYIIDIDNNRYEIVKIGSQLWMAENLRTTRFNDGTPIDLVTDDVTWQSLSTPAYTWYENTSSPYGALYNFYVVQASGNVCPAGWHVPSQTEWSTLTTYLGGISVAGGKMKETGLAHWVGTTPETTNSSGFTALPGGLRGALFDDYGLRGHYWSSTVSAHGFPLAQGLISGLNQIYTESSLSFKNGLSIRCVRD